MNTRLSPTSLAGLLRAGAAGVALASLLTACGGSHAASDSGTAAPGAAASADAGTTAASSAPDAAASPAEAGGAMAGSGAPGGRTGGRRLVAKALASVGLTDDQKSQIRAIMKATRTENANADPETRRANYKAAQAKVEAVLTPAQLTAYHAKLAELRAAQAQSSPSQ